MIGPSQTLPRAINDRDEIRSPEERIMRATILLAIEDACGWSAASRLADRDQNRQAALRWFKEGGDDFRYVCVLAGFDADQTRRAALSFIFDRQGKPRPAEYRRPGVGRSVRVANTPPLESLAA